jgi:hypothetical protein
MRSTILVAVLAVLFAGWLIYSVQRSSPVTCEACITYAGRTKCAKTAAATEEEALRQAATTICGQISGGMTETLECSRTPPTRSKCTGEAAGPGKKY